MALANATWARARPAIALAAQLLSAATELLLKCDVARSLHRRHEPREILLLGFDDPDSLPLEPNRSIQ